MGIPKGTKLTDAPKSRVIRVRIDKETSDKLECVIKRTNQTISEIIRKGIEKQYADISK